MQLINRPSIQQTVPTSQRLGNTHFPTQRPARRKLLARWVKRNGQLTCQWIAE
ncbi:MAG: hypothetical protein F6K42_07530 [Leptolyngbya sp. SIO1D8]|nr:hypothetical protein [Leptolyngbya sp. SIO1D8]